MNTLLSLISFFLFTTFFFQEMMQSWNLHSMGIYHLRDQERFVMRF